MCITNATMTDGDDDLKAQVVKDNKHFKALLDLIPPSAYFSVEQKNELLGNVADSDDDEDEEESQNNWKRFKHRKLKGINNPLSALSVSQITEKTLKGESIVPSSGPHRKKHKDSGKDRNGDIKSFDDEIDAKHQGKKQSRTAKANKGKGREIQRREARIEELQARLRVKLEEMKAKKNSGKPVTSQEQKRLRRQEKKLTSKLKNNKSTVNKEVKNKEQKEKRMHLAEGLRSPPQNPVLNNNGDPVKSKFDFSMFAMGNDKSRTSDLHGKDYKRLLEKVEKRKEQVQELKEKDPEKGKKLEEKLAWQSMLSKAKGEKVKDDVHMLKKSMKRKEKLKEYRQKKWDERVKKVDELKDKKQQKRQANLDKRKSDKNDKKRKKLVKKGRVIPGF